MNSEQLKIALENMSNSADFPSDSAELLEEVVADGMGVAAVGPILQFMEAHPATDYGMPGPLVHFVEQFSDNGYEDRLLESIRRKPTRHTLWMLNRVINAAKTPVEKTRLVVEMRGAQSNALADRETKEVAAHFLARVTGSAD